jgi:hypothetical protein
MVDVDVPTDMRDQHHKTNHERDGEQQHPKPTEEPEQRERKHAGIVAL